MARQRNRWQQVKLRAIVAITSGYQFRGKVEPDDDGPIDLIQIKDISDRRQLIVSDLTRVSIENADRYLVQPDDVLFLSRGHRMYGLVVPELRRDTVVSSYFFVMRPRSADVFPRYLAWVLGEPEFQHRLGTMIRGSHMPLISRSDFSDLSIPLPSLETQRKIVEINELMLREASLLDQLQARRAELVRGVSRQLLSGKLREEVF